jgi:hypothetical protein
MSYQDDMRKIIDIVKRMSFEAPLQQTMADLKQLNDASKDLTDRIETRVRKSLQPADKEAEKKPQSKPKKKPIKKFPSIQPPKPPQKPLNPNASSTNNASSNTLSAKDISDIGQQLKKQQQTNAPITPIKPIGTKDGNV